MDVMQERLPKELITLIISFMDNRNKCNIRTVSRYWCSNVYLDEFTIHFASNKNLPEIVHHFSKYYANKPIGLTLKKIVWSANHPSLVHYLEVLTHLTSLEMDLAFSIRWLNDSTLLYKLTNLQRLPYMKIGSVLTNLTTLQVTARADLAHLPLYTKLRELNIRQSRSIPGLFGLIRNPRRLTALSFSVPRATLTESDLNTLTQLNNLKELKMNSRTQTQLPPFLQYLTSLESLNSVNCDVHNEVFKLSRLTYLVIQNGGEQLTHINQKLSALHNLKYVSTFSITEDPDISFLSHMTNLERFGTSSSEMAKKTLKKLNSKNLKKFEMRGLRGDNSFIMDYIEKLSTLLELRLEGNLSFLNDTENYSNGLQPLKNLTKLFMINGALLSSTMLDALENLKWFDFRYGTVSRDFTLKKLTNLEHLYIDTLWPTYDSLHYLTRLTYLELPLQAKMFNDNPTAFVNLPLRTLIFTKHFVAPEIWSVLTQLRDLEHLQIWRVDSEEIIESFSVLTNLTHLTMKKMKLTNHIRGIHLTKLTSLQELSFRAHPRKYYARLPPDYLMQKGLTRLYKLKLR